MTLQRPMFPPRADRKNCSLSERFSTSSEPAPVETCYGVEQVNGAAREPFKALSGPVLAAPGAMSGASVEAAPAGLRDDFYLRTDLTPEEVFRALGRLRNEAEAAVERLIALIDELDGDPEAELAGDELEPSLAAPENHPNRTLLLRSTKEWRDISGTQIDWAGGNDDGREGDPGHDDREGDELEHGGDEHDGREPDVCDEPSLGWTSLEASCGRYAMVWGGYGDFEQSCDDEGVCCSGVADADGLMEQAAQQFERSNVGVC